MKNLKSHLYIASAVWLSGVPANHIAKNGSRQFTVIARTPSVAALARLIGSRHTPAHLKNMGCHKMDGVAKWEAVARQPDTIYYQWPPFGDPADLKNWHEYKPI